MKNSELSRKIWLNYFNRTMKDTGVISEDQYRKLKLNIAQKYKGAPEQRIRNRGAHNF